MNKHQQIELGNVVVGDWFYTSENDQIELYQMLENESDILVKAFWPQVLDAKIETADLRTACTIYSSENNTIFYLKSGEITTEDLEEIAQFKRISAGKKARENHFQLLIETANNAIATNDFESAISVLTEAAPYSKLDLTIYQKRGFCYLKLNRFLEALADFEYVLGQTHHEESIEHCIAIYDQMGNKEKALEKRKLLEG